MTALLSRDGSNFSLVCDGCGQQATDLGTTMHHWDLAWRLLAQHGWTGDRLATGPHACGRCAPAPALLRLAEHARGRVRSAPAARVSRRVAVHEIGDVLVVELAGDLDLAVNVRLRDLLTPARWARHLVFDLTHVRSMDSGTLDVLVRAREQAVDRDAHVCLVGTAPTVRDALRLLCLDQLFPGFPDRSTALAWLEAATEPDRVAHRPDGTAAAATARTAS